MKYTLTNYRTKRLLIIALILILILLPLVIFIFTHFLDASVVVILTLSSMFLSIIIGLYFSKEVVDISLDDNKIQFKNTNLLLTEIIGYYINKRSPILTQIEFKDINYKFYRFTSLNFGQRGKDFELFLSDLLDKAHKANKDFKELSFYDFHHGQYKFSQVFVYIMIVVAIILNLVYLYLILFKNKQFNWRLIFLDFLVISMYTFYKQNKEKYIKNKTTANTVQKQLPGNE